MRETRAVAEVNDLISDQLFIVCSKYQCKLYGTRVNSHIFIDACLKQCVLVFVMKNLPPLECESVKSNLNRNTAVNPDGRCCNFTCMALT